MNEIISDFKSVTLTKTQKLLTLLAIIIIILANLAPSISDYKSNSMQLYRDSAVMAQTSVQDFYVGKLFTTQYGDSQVVVLGLFGKLIRLK